MTRFSSGGGEPADADWRATRLGSGLVNVMTRFSSGEREPADAAAGAQ